MLKLRLSVKTGEAPEWAERLREVLAKVPIVSAVEIRDTRTHQRDPVDAEVNLTIGDKGWVILVETKASGQPRYARDAAARLSRAVAATGNNAYGVVVAPFISPQSRELLREEGVGWLDMTGNSSLSFGGIHIETDKTQRDPFVTKRAQQSLFAPKSARLLRVMLEHPGPWKVADLSKRANVSLGQVSNVRQQLLDKEWAEVGPAGGLRLRRPAAVLDAWREAVRPPTVAARGYTLVHGKEMDTQLRLLFGRAEIEAAHVLLASHSTARRLAPFARVAGEFFYADDKGLDLITRHFSVAPTDKGENLTVFEVPDDGLWLEAIERPQGMRSAGLIQTYLDLWASGERGQEAAEHFRRELIDPNLAVTT